MMYARGLHRLLHWHAIVQYVENSLKRGADNPGTSRSADHELRPFALQNDGRRHAAQRPLSRLQGVSLIADQTVNIAARMDREIVHLIVENNTGGRHQQFGTKPRVDRNGASHSVAETIDHAEMRGSAQFRLEIDQAVIFWRMGFRRGNTTANPCRVLF